MQRDTENPAPATAPRQLRAPVTPRDSAANAAPVHIDDALAKRAKAALETRSQVVHACAEANIAYACVQELQDALAKSRGVTAALRSNYQELYDMLQRGGAQQAGAGTEREREFADTLLACENFQKKQRLQLEDCQAALQAAKREAAEASKKEQAAAEQARELRRLLSAAGSELSTEQAARASLNAAARQAAAEAAEADQRASEHRAAAEAAESRARLAEETLKSHELSIASRERSELEQSAQRRAAEERVAALEADLGAATARCSRLESEMASQGASTEQRLVRLQAQLAEVEARALAAERRVAVELAAAVSERNAAVESAAAATDRASELQSLLQQAKEECDALRVLSASPPLPPASPPKPSPTTPPRQPASDYQALRSELDGWRMVAEQAEVIQKRMERELKVANSTIAALRAAAAADGKENEKNASVQATAQAEKDLRGRTTSTGAARLPGTRRQVTVD